MKKSTVEKFPIADLAGLRDELTQAGLDSWQAAELISSFLSGRGYGVSNVEARQVVNKIGPSGSSFEHMQRELESVAYVM